MIKVTNPENLVAAALQGAREELLKESLLRRSGVRKEDESREMHNVLFNVLSSACYIIQTMIGQGDGGPAGIFFSGSREEEAYAIFLSALKKADAMASEPTAESLIADEEKLEFENLMLQYIDFEAAFAED